MNEAGKMVLRKPVCKFDQYDGYGAVFSLPADLYMPDRLLA